MALKYKIIVQQKITFKLLILIMLIFLFGSIVHTQDVYLQTEGTVRKIVVVLNEWLAQSGSESSPSHYSVKNLSAIPKFDLEFTGLFDVITTSQELTAELDYPFLRELKAIVATKGTYSLKGEQLQVDTEVYDVAKGTMIWGKRYTGDVESQREIMHRLSDTILASFGLSGIGNSKIAFISNAKGNKELYMMDYDGYNVIQLTNDKSITLSPSWSPDTTKIAYVSYKRGNPDLYVIDVSSRVTKCIASFQGQNTAPAWSPDGRYIAASLSKDGNGEIYLIPADGHGVPRRLTFDRGIDTSPCWSPSGKQIAFVSDRSGSPQIYIMDAIGSNLRRLTFEGKYNASPNWSPRGDYISYVTMQGNELNICIIQVDGQGLRQLTTGYGNCENPSWSPDGRHICFSSNRYGSEQIFAVRVSDNHIVQLSNLKGNNTEPDWTK
ncbi:MAG: Tol-Pal system beta propeller repeat protein TolB [bacterium]|nr:Tol-Pal system beta propeller repeat protein TolB [bacterium]